MTGWKRRSSAASFSMCLRYSSSVVAPMQLQLAARQRRLHHVAGVDGALGRAGADHRVQLVDEEHHVLRPSGSRSITRLEALLELAAVLGAGHHARRCPAPSTRLSRSISGTSPSTIRCARPSTMAVLPTPGSPMSTGLFLVRRESTWITRLISSSRPITGSSLPWRASSVRSRVYLLEHALAGGRGLPVLTGGAHLRQGAARPSSVMPASRRMAAPGPSPSRKMPKSRCSVPTKSSPSFCASLTARSMAALARGVM